MSDEIERLRKRVAHLEEALRNIAAGRVGDQLIFRPDLYAQARLDAELIK